jgi:hypothetical protein
LEASAVKSACASLDTLGTFPVVQAASQRKAATAAAANIHFEDLFMQILINKCNRS